METNYLLLMKDYSDAVFLPKLTMVHQRKTECIDQDKLLENLHYYITQREPLQSLQNIMESYILWVDCSLTPF